MLFHRKGRITCNATFCYGIRRSLTEKKQLELCLLLFGVLSIIFFFYFSFQAFLWTFHLFILEKCQTTTRDSTASTFPEFVENVFFFTLQQAPELLLLRVQSLKTLSLFVSTNKFYCFLISHPHKKKSNKIKKKWRKSTARKEDERRCRFVMHFADSVEIYRFQIRNVSFYLTV